ncbi:hypothetical protein D6D28_03604 [Aureobasidium pullulans]|uniref:Uncharacterized protein n=1 Tax=Aureobasidium pullulans TaxID=5580 RepID=A0A4S8SPV9_AURPU|nr:hypothetical protein D6D28_03604 [Aureobasidium pullulans]
MDDPLKGYFNHQGVRHIGFRNHRKYRRSYHGSLNHRHHHYNVRQLNSKYAHTPPTLFHLPLELRYQIYNQLLHSDGNNTVYMGITLDPTSDLDPITRLTASTNPLLESTFYIKAGVFTDMTLKPYAVALKISRIYTMGSGSYIQRWRCLSIGKG